MGNRENTLSFTNTHMKTPMQTIIPIIVSLKTVIIIDCGEPVGENVGITEITNN